VSIHPGLAIGLLALLLLGGFIFGVSRRPTSRRHDGGPILGDGHHHHDNGGSEDGGSD
jgi:hypothetical protein